MEVEMNQSLEQKFIEAQTAHQQNQFDKAKTLYESILSNFPNHGPTHHFLGLAHAQTGNILKAIVHLEKAVELTPDNPVFANNLGEALRRNGDFEKAIRYYKQAISIAPNFSQSYYNLGLAFRDIGETAQSIEQYKKAIQANPEHLESYRNLGNSYAKLQMHEKAVESYQRALQINPDYAEVHNNLGLSLNKLNKTQEAIRHYQKALMLKSDSAEAHKNFVSSLVDTNEFDRAEKHCRQVLHYFPEMTEMYVCLGTIFIAKKRNELAVDELDKALSINPNCADAHNYLGSLFVESNQLDEAAFHCQRAVELNPDNFDSLCTLASILEKQGKIEEAKKWFRKIREREPDNDILNLHIDSLFPMIPESSCEIEKYRKQLDNTLDIYIEKNIPFNLDRIGFFNCQTLFSMAYQGKSDRLLKEKFAKLLRNYQARTVPKTRNTKPHICFLVTSGHEYVFTKCTSGLLNNISTERFKVTIACPRAGYEESVKPSLTTQDIGFIAISKSIEEVLHTIRMQHFDIIYYWEVGSDNTNYFLPFFKLAPVQFTSWGWPVTSGIPQMDYYVSSDLIEDEDSEQDFSEKVVRLNSLLAYYYRPSLPERTKSRSQFGLSDNDNVYLNVQTPLKIHPEFDRLVAEILRRDEKALVLFVDSKQKHLGHLLKARMKNGFPEESRRIKYMPYMPREDYLNLLLHADVVLDTIYYTGGNTTYDCLAFGVPVITLPDKFSRSRLTSALYKQMNVYDCIADSEDDYINIAVKIATDKTLRNEISSKILQASDVLFENSKVIDEFERFFTDAVAGEV